MASDRLADSHHGDHLTRDSRLRRSYTPVTFLALAADKTRERALLRALGRDETVSNPAKTLRVYLDTSVIGGCFDPEFARWSNLLVRVIRAGRLRAVLSAVTAAEIEAAPPQVRNLHRRLISEGAELVALTDEMLELQDAYQQHRVLAGRFRNDMLHIAVATVACTDVLVSWNFKHIVRFDRIRRFNAVNRRLGYDELSIYSPREVVPDDEALD